MKMWKSIHRLGMLPSKYCVRVLMKMCAKFGEEAELLQTLYEGEAAGMLERVNFASHIKLVAYW